MNTDDNNEGPRRSEKLKPVEFVSLSGGMAFFVGVIILMSTRDFALASIGCGVTFVVALVVIAMLVLGRTGDVPNQHAAGDSDAARPQGEGVGVSRRKPRRY